jgi:plasmid stability protein
VWITLQLSDEESEALRRRAAQESRSMEDVARQAIREYLEHRTRADLLDRVLDAELPRYAETLERFDR